MVGQALAKLSSVLPASGSLTVSRATASNSPRTRLGPTASRQMWISQSLPPWATQILQHIVRPHSLYRSCPPAHTSSTSVIRGQVPALGWVWGSCKGIKGRHQGLEHSSYNHHLRAPESELPEPPQGRHCASASPQMPASCARALAPEGERKVKSGNKWL